MAFNWAALLGVVTEIGISEAGLFVKSASGQTILAAEEPIAQDLIAMLVSGVAPAMTPATANNAVAAMASVHPAAVVAAAQTIQTVAPQGSVPAAPAQINETFAQESLGEKLATIGTLDLHHAKEPASATGSPKV